MALNAYQRDVIAREAARLHAQSNRDHGHPCSSSVWPLMDTLARWPWLAHVAGVLGVPCTLADWMPDNAASREDGGRT